MQGTCCASQVKERECVASSVSLLETACVPGILSRVSGSRRQRRRDLSLVVLISLRAGSSGAETPVLRRRGFELPLPKKGYRRSPT
jgi:hypothetical protein